MDDLKLIDKKALAKIVDRSVRTIERWKRAGKLPPTNPVLTRPTWTMSQIVVWLRHSTTNSDTVADSD
jgi:phage terminase Nu1 subunit (DNA packaging protein)